jgi:hypothetical protein
MKFPLKPDKIQEAIFFSKEFGPVFGAGHDFLMTDMSTVSFSKALCPTILILDMKRGTRPDQVSGTFTLNDDASFRRVSRASATMN